MVSMSRIEKDKRVKLTDKKKKKIIADYSLGQNMRETSRLNKVSVTTVSRLIKKCDPEVQQKVTQKIEENNQDTLKYIESIGNEINEVIGLSVVRLKEKLSTNDKFVSPKDIATVYGIFSDKALKIEDLKIRREEIKSNDTNVDKTNENILNIVNLINNPKPVRDENSIDE